MPSLFPSSSTTTQTIIPTWRITMKGSTIEARSNTSNETVVYSSSTNLQAVLNSIIGSISPAGTATVIELGAGVFPETSGFASITGSKIGNIKIKGQGIGITMIQPQAGCPYALDISGSLGTAKNLTANSNLADNTVTVSTTDTAGFALGDYVFITSSKTWDSSGSGVGKQGEIKKVLSVNTGTGVITLNEGLYDSYATIDTATIAKINMLKNIILEDISILPVSSGYTGQTQVLARFQYIDNLQLRKVEVGDTILAGGGTNIQVNSCINSDLDIIATMTGNYAWIGLPSTGPYGLWIGQACQHVKAKVFVRGTNWRHAVDGGCINSSFAGIPRDITISGTAEGIHYSAFDFHEDGEGITFQNCNINTSSWKTNDQTGYGVFARCKNVIVNGCNIRGATSGIQVTGLGHNSIITNNYIANIRKDSGGNHGIGIEISAGMNGGVINGNIFYDIEGQAIYQGNNTGTNDLSIVGNQFLTCDAISLKNSNNIILANNRINNGSNKAVNMVGTSTGWTFTGNDATGSAISTRVGTNKFRNNTNLYNTEIRGLSTTQSGNGSTKVFNIAHGLSTTPSFANAVAETDDTKGSFKVTSDTTNIIITYTIAPPSGTNNLQWYYIAEV